MTMKQMTTSLNVSNITKIIKINVAKAQRNIETIQKIFNLELMEEKERNQTSQITNNIMGLDQETKKSSPNIIQTNISNL